MTLKCDAKIEQTLLPCGFKTGMRNCVSFHENTEQSENLYFDGLFLSKA